MKLIRMTRDCALSFLERQHKAGAAEKLADAFEHLMFREGVISLLSRRTQMVTIVRFLPAMEIENDLLKELHPTMLGGAIRMMLMAPISTGSALLGYFFLVDEQGQNKVVLEYGATKAAYRAFKGTGNQKMSKLRHTITLAKTMRDLILLTQNDMREHEECWSAEEVRERSMKKEIWPEDTFEVVFQSETENEKRKADPDYLFYLNEDFLKLKPLSERHVRWMTNWGERLREKLKNPQQTHIAGKDPAAEEETQ